jgi:vacuolar protein sorting-associated protein 13A/C
MNVVQPGGTDILFVSTPQYMDRHQTTTSFELHIQGFRRTRPEYLTVHEGIDQSVDIKMSTLVFRAAPERVLGLYDFIMTTFVSSNEDVRSASRNLLILARKTIRNEFR